MAGLLVAALIIVPLVEIYLLVQVGQVLGALPTILLLLAMSLLGAYLLRREGGRTFRAFRSAMGSGRVPAKEVADGALVIFGGALLLTPGFATDLLGLACVLPLTRAGLRKVLTRVVAARLGVPGMVGGLAADHLRQRSRPQHSRPPGSRPPGSVVEGEVVDGSAADRAPDDPHPPR